MRLKSTRRTAIAATVALAAALAAAGPGAAHSAAAGGLSVDPGILEHVARPGGIGAVKVSNTTSSPMKVRLAVRPWRQARNGDVEPNRRRTLGRVRPSRGSFWLRAGATRTVGFGLKSRPRRRSLYGAIVITGAPRKRSGNIRVAYRLVTSLRLHPPRRARRFRAKAGRLVQFGTTRRGGLLLAVTNIGNTIVPIGGRVRIRGRHSVLKNNISAKKILPGATVFLRLARLRGTLSRGRYGVAVVLKQGKRRVAALRRRGFFLR